MVLLVAIDYSRGKGGGGSSASGALGSKHERSVGFEAGAFLWLREHVGLKGRALEMLQFHHVLFDLFDHVVNTSKEMFAPFVIAGELLGQCDQ